MNTRFPLFLLTLAAACLHVAATDTTTTPGAKAAVTPKGIQVWKSRLSETDLNLNAELRLRHDVVDNLRKTSGIPAKYNTLRYRTRIWGSYAQEEFRICTRIVNEFRHYFQPRSNYNYRPPDEVVLDNLYIKFYDIYNYPLDVTIGRQDLYYGAGRVILTGTPYAASRSSYFDAIKASLKFSEQQKLDFLGVYNPAKTELSAGRAYYYNQHRYRTRQNNAMGANSKGNDQYGGGLYYIDSSIQELPFESYYLFKRENKAYLRDGSGTLPGRYTHTIGTRLLSKYSSTLFSEFEAAAQRGEKDSGALVAGYMGYSDLTWQPVVSTLLQPFANTSFYYLSGDKNRTGKHNSDEAWNPLWARDCTIRFSSYMYGVGYWSNLMYPKFTLGVKHPQNHQLTVHIGSMYVAAKDGLGEGDGRTIGHLCGIRYDAPWFKDLIGKWGRTTGFITGEILDPGDYYTTDKLAYFFRWQVITRF